MLGHQKKTCKWYPGEKGLFRKMQNGEIWSYKQINEKRMANEIVIRQSLPGLQFETVWQCEFPKPSEKRKFELFKASLFDSQPKQRMSISEAILPNSADVVNMCWNVENEPNTKISHLDLNSSFSYQESFKNANGNDHDI